MDQRPPPPPPQEPFPADRAGRGQRWRARASVAITVALLALGGSWALLLLGDDTVSPLAVIDAPTLVVVVVVGLHVVSAPAAWVLSLMVAKEFGRMLWVAFGVVVVPIASAVSLLVLMTDAVVWRDDLGEWLPVMFLAFVGPFALTAQATAALRMMRSRGRR